MFEERESKGLIQELVSTGWMIYFNFYEIV